MMSFLATYRIIPNKRTPPNKRTRHSLNKSKVLSFHENDHSFLNNGPIFNLKPPLESSECQLSPWPHVLAPGAFIRDNTVLFIFFIFFLFMLATFDLQMSHSLSSITAIRLDQSQGPSNLMVRFPFRERSSESCGCPLQPNCKQPSDIMKMKLCHVYLLQYSLLYSSPFLRFGSKALSSYKHTIQPN